jgi:hypothetical protein
MKSLKLDRTSVHTWPRCPDELFHTPGADSRIHESPEIIPSGGSKAQCEVAILFRTPGDKRPREL